MKNEFYEYCSAIGVSDPLLSQLREMHSVAKSLFGAEIEAMFISEYRDQSGVRNYQNIFFFSEYKFAYFVFPNFAVCNVLGWKGLFPVVQTSFENYDFQKANTKSKLRLVLSTETFIGARHNQAVTLSASDNNCDYLFKVYTKMILPHL